MSSFGSRIFNKVQSMEQEVKDLYLKATLHSTTPTIVSGAGFSSFVRNGVGDYTITLSDKYYSLKHFRGTILSATAVDARVQIHTNNIQSKTVRFLVLDGATPVDVVDGTPILIQMDVKNTNQPY
jgi:hypothetical protein